MKTLLPVLFISLIVFGCAKGRTCTQTTTNPDHSVTTYVATYPNLTSKEKKDIENLGTYTESDGTDYKTVCK